MEWLAIPGIMLGLAALLLVLAYWWPSDAAWCTGLAVLVVMLFVLLICGARHYADIGKVRTAESYYDNIIAPHVVHEGCDYVVVDNVQSAVWQAGEFNLSWYNAFLKSRRYWDSVPLWNTVTVAPPDRLKYVRIAN